MTTQTATIADFLLARIADDEAAARKASHQKVAGPLIGWNADSAFLTTMNQGLDPGERAHIARHDPARVLAECAAKRAILELEETTGAVAWEVPDALAAVYADHPDFNPDWV